MAKPRMTPVSVIERMLPVEVPEWCGPRGRSEHLDVLYLAASGGSEASWNVHRRVTEQREAFNDYRRASSVAADREGEAIDRFNAAYKAHDTEGMKRAALDRWAALQESKAFDWLPGHLVMADGVEPEASAALLKAMQGRRLHATLWAALLVAKHEAYVDGLEREVRDTLRVGASAHLEFRDAMEAAAQTAVDRQATGAEQAKAKMVIDEYTSAIDFSESWGL